eukprot:1179786-Prorocentrum_minimum.AAC.5
MTTLLSPRRYSSAFPSSSELRGRTLQQAETSRRRRAGSADPPLPPSPEAPSLGSVPAGGGCGGSRGVGAAHPYGLGLPPACTGRARWGGRHPHSPGGRLRFRGERAGGGARRGFRHCPQAAVHCSNKLAAPTGAGGAAGRGAVPHFPRGPRRGADRPSAGRAREAPNEPKRAERTRTGVRNNISSFYGSSCANNGKGALNTRTSVRNNITSFYGSSCADNGKGALNT